MKISSLFGSVASAVGSVVRKVENVAKGVPGSAQSVGNQVGDAFEDAGDAVLNGGAAALGYLEYYGHFDFPAKAYTAKVSDGLYRGSSMDASGLANLKATAGIKSEVDLRAEADDAPNARAAGINYLHLPIIDNTPPTEAEMVRFLNFVTASQNQPAYVHCQAGVGRTGVAVACYRMAVQHWSADQAVAEAQQYGCKLPDQIDFIRQFGADLAAGKIPGYSV